MAFKNAPPPVTVPESPEQLILDLPRRKIKGILLHQGEMMRSYAQTAVNEPDVALQLPTGSGKTLVGLMIGEWRRRKFQERVVYLCPTRQLVNQVVEQAEEYYGLTVRGFTGPSPGFDPGAKSEYLNGDRIAVTTYSALFNTKPFFDNPQNIIIDDAHAAENYIAELWTLRISRIEHPILHAAISGLLKTLIHPTSYARLVGKWRTSTDVSWVDKLPTPEFAKIHQEFATIVDSHVNETKLRFPWRMLCDRLHACHLYLSSQDILLRPLIPPTWTHAPFAGAQQRIFMSATLGAGGDLERLTGRRKITRLPVPSGWDKQGIGRRYFIFPEMSFNEKEIQELRRQLMSRAGRSLVLVPSEQAQEELVLDVNENLQMSVFGADDIENSKKAFIAEPNAVAIVANRYDGIDFPGDDCRLLFVDGLPRAMNSQERFLMSRMGATALFNERIQTRVLQAIGRCTRSLEDFSAVVITGDDIPNYLTDRTRRSYLHPELQAELDFGIEQSKQTTIGNLIENFDIFLRNDLEWEAANNQILGKRELAIKQPFPAMEELAAAVSWEIAFQAALWQSDYEKALDAAERVLTELKNPTLRGYRALWHYLAGSAALLGNKGSSNSLATKARGHFSEAKKAADSIPWLVELSRYQSAADQPVEDKSILYGQLERVESIFERMGNLHDRKFDKREKEVLEGLESTSKCGPFEAAQVLLGEMLGFISGNEETDAAPDPWWITGNICLIFEDHAGALPTSTLDATKARQVASHPDWVKAHVPESEGTQIIPVLVTPVTLAEAGAMPHLERVLLWPLEDFKEWARQALIVLRDIRRTFSEPGDLVWRMQAAEAFEKYKLDAPSLVQGLQKQPAAKMLKNVSAQE